MTAPVRRSRGCYGQGTQTRAVLEILTDPATPADIATRLNLPRNVARDTVRHLHHTGWVDRVARGLYVRNAAGTAALTPARAGRRYLSGCYRTPPAGRGWTPERRQWLMVHFARLGHHRCAHLLGMNANTVHAYATKLNLAFGDVPGYHLVVDVARLLNRSYGHLWSRAKAAGVLTYPAASRHSTQGRKGMVPDAWVAQVALEVQPPTPDDVPLHDLRAQLGVSRTQISRLTRPHAYLRTPRGLDRQARLYVPREVADSLLREYRDRQPAPVRPTTTRDGIRAALCAAGAAGLSERELRETLGVSRAIIRVRLEPLLLSGEARRHRAGTTLDPYVYRLALHADAPEPPRRTVVIPGRPRALPQAAD